MSYLFPYAGSGRRVVIAKSPPKPRPKAVEPAPQPPPVESARPSIPKLLNAVCELHGVKFKAMMGKVRSQRLVCARRDFIVRCRDHGYSFNRIALALQKDHSTCVYHYQCYLQGATVKPYVPVRKC